MIDILNIGNRMRGIRKDRTDLTMKDVALKLDIAYNSLWQYETGQVDPPIWVLCCLADLYKVSVAYLIGEQE